MQYKRTYYKGTRYEVTFYYKDKKHKIVHREDGPAIEYKHQIYNNSYWLDDEPYSKKQYLRILKFGAFA